MAGPGATRRGPLNHAPHGSDASMQAKSYQDYLSSPAWKHRRDLVLWRSRGICEGCQSSKATEVHHLTYEHVGEELLFELVAVCRACHEKIHPAPGREQARTRTAGTAGRK
jgi:hypothetical protein